MWIKHLPNTITLFSVFSACCTVVFLLHGQMEWAFIAYALSSVADFLDGAVARMLKVSSELGKQLDSLADMLAFGFVPGLILYLMLSQPNANALQWQALPGFLVTVFAALRLAKFNLDTRQSDQFIGLPTPACTMFCMGLLLSWHRDALGWRDMLGQSPLLLTCTAALSLLMVSDLPMFSLKMKNLNWKGNEIRFIFAAASLLALVFLREAALMLIIAAYIALSILLHLFKGKQQP